MDPDGANVEGRAPMGAEDSYWRGTLGDAEAAPESVRADADRTARRAMAYQTVYRKDHIVAGLFAIFLGVFGMHKFYLGYNRVAFIMLAVSIVGSVFSLGLAAAVVWIIAIIEGILYLARSQTDFDRIYVHGKREWF